MSGYLGQQVVVPFNFAGSGALDDTESFEVFFAVPEAISIIDDFGVWVRFTEFTATAKSASSGGGSTSGSSVTASGGGATSGGSSHQHAWAQHVSDTAGSFTNRRYQTETTGSPKEFNLQVASTGGPFLTIAESPHTHSTPNHTHPSHDHSTPNHTHGLTYGIFKETLPGSFDVTMTVRRRPLDLSSGWSVVYTTTLTDQEQSLDLSEELDEVDLGPGLYRLAFVSDAGQPNGGRLGVDVMGWAMGSIASI